MRLLNKIYLLLFISLSLGLKAQNYQERQKQLEAQKISIKKEIQQINNLINDSRKKSRGLADELEDIQLKISVRDRLIRINNSQVNNLNNIISNQNERIADLEVDLKKLKEFVQGKKKVDDHDFSEHVSTLKALRNEHGESHERFVCEQAKKLNVVLASHDDTTKDHVKQSVARGVQIAEFPTTKEAARSCKKENISIMMGAPNLIRQGSHSGNVSAIELAQDDLLDIVSSDYVPAALFQSSMVLADLWGSLPRAMRTVTLSPAKASGLQDRGVIDIGNKADLIMFDRHKEVSLIKSVWSDGRSVF